MRDNVTPFRPRRPPPRPKRSFNLQSHRGKALAAQGLTIAAFAAAFLLPGFPENFVSLALGIGAIAIAASNRDEGMPWARTHHEHVVRTVAIGAALWTLSSLLLLFGLGLIATIVFWTRAAIAIWACLRAGLGFGLAAFRRPIPNPTGPLI